MTKIEKIFATRSVRAPREIRLAFAGPEPTTPSSSRDAMRNAFDAPGPPAFHFAVGPPPAPKTAPDSFPHSRHEKLACLVCHETGEGHGRLTFERPRGCAICHHQAPAQSRCASCHKPAEYSGPIAATAIVTVPGHAPRPRQVEFRHAIHADRVCRDCHTTPVTLAPDPAKAACKDCHENHHAAGRNCSSCHAPVQPMSSHESVQASHQRCDACHTAATIARLTPTRSFCAACHVEKAKDHFDNKECTTCHFLTEPSAYRPMLSTRSRE